MVPQTGSLQVFGYCKLKTAFFCQTFVWSKQIEEKMFNPNVFTAHFQLIWQCQTSRIHIKTVS